MQRFITGGEKIINNPELNPCRCDHAWLFPTGSYYCDIDKKRAYRIHRQNCPSKTGTHGHLINYKEWAKGKCTFFDTVDEEPLGKSIIIKKAKKEIKKSQQGGLL